MKIINSRGSIEFEGSIIELTRSEDKNDPYYINNILARNKENGSISWIVSNPDKLPFTAMRKNDDESLWAFNFDGNITSGIATRIGWRK